MTIAIKMAGSLYVQITADLSRPHAFAAERVGFVMGRMGSLPDGGKLILLNHYHPIPDAHYIPDPSVGARIGPDAMTAATQAVYHGRPFREGVFHIHMHPHFGQTGMSHTDAHEIPRMLPGFQSVGRQAAHGIIILSRDHGSAWVWLPAESNPLPAEIVSVIGVPLRVFGRRAWQ